MLFLGLFDLLIPHVPYLEQDVHRIFYGETVLAQMSPDSKIEVVPFVIEGPVENFDTGKRAVEWSKKVSRRWCGNYSSFNNESNFVVTLLLNEVKPTGQIVSLTGDIYIGDFKTNFKGSVNAKSDQIELILGSKKLIYDIEPGGKFIALDDTKIFVWRSPRLSQSGGLLTLNQNCVDQKSKANSIFTIL